MIHMAGCRPAIANAGAVLVRLVVGKVGTGAGFSPTALAFHLSGLIGTARNPNMLEIRINGFFLENRLHLQF
jgi:hypothetical protein